MNNRQTSGWGLAAAIIAILGAVTKWIHTGIPPDEIGWSVIGSSVAYTVAFFKSADAKTVAKLNDKVDELVDDQ